MKLLTIRKSGDIVDKVEITERNRNLLSKKDCVILTNGIKIISRKIDNRGITSTKSVEATIVCPGGFCNVKGFVIDNTFVRRTLLIVVTISLVRLCVKQAKMSVRKLRHNVHYYPQLFHPNVPIHI